MCIEGKLLLNVLTIIVARHGNAVSHQYVSDTAETADFEPKWHFSTDTATDTGRSTRFGHGCEPLRKFWCRVVQLSLQ